MIRSLLEAKLSYREIARIAKCSHGSVHAELVAFRKEKELQEQERMKQAQDQGLKESIAELNFPTEKLEPVGEISNAAKISVQEIQGVYYETFD